MNHFPHTSRAGHYGLQFPADLLDYLSHVSNALLPGNGEYPSGAVAQVPTFIQERASDNDQQILQQISGHWPAGSDQEAATALREMEQSDAVSFAYLREFVFHGYYSSHRVLAVMADRGYRYHGAPQPLGYRIDDVMKQPTKPRGTYIATENVQHVAN